MGCYQELGNDVLLLASVRSIDEEVKLKPATEIPKGKLNALRIMQRQEFNYDDIQDFKNPQVDREGNDGLLKFFLAGADKNRCRVQKVFLSGHCTGK